MDARVQERTSIVKFCIKRRILVGTIRQRADGRLFLDFRDQFGRRKREVLKTDNTKIAQKILMKREVEVFEDKYLDKRKDGKIPFKDLAQKALDFLLERRKAHIFFKVVICKLVREFGRMYVCQLTPAEITKYQSRRATEVSKSTVNRELAVLKRIFSLGIKWSLITSNPVKQVEFYKEPRIRIKYLTEEQIQSLLSHCAGTLKMIVKTALLTGMRKEEILGLKWGDIDFTNNLIILDKTKNDEIREIPISPELRDLFWNMSSGKSADSPVFTKLDGTRYADIRTPYQTALRKAGIDNFRFHDLRHTFASQMVMAGVDILTVKELLGHKDISMTLRYAHLAPKHKADAIMRLTNKIVKKEPIFQAVDSLQMTYQN